MKESMKDISSREHQQHALKVNKGYIMQKQEMDKSFERIITPYIQGKRLKILDACCGMGHIIFLLNQICPDSEFLGIDVQGFLLDEGRRLAGKNKKINFKNMDVYRLHEYFDKEFDISISWKTISFLDHYEDMIKTLFRVTKSHIFLSSMFYDGELDFQTRVLDTGSGKDERTFINYYNVYSWPCFQRFCLNKGARLVEGYDFKIGIDLPRQDTDKMGTFTKRLDNGERIQISGAVIMSWKIIRIDL